MQAEDTVAARRVLVHHGPGHGAIAGSLGKQRVHTVFTCHFNLLDVSHIDITVPFLDLVLLLIVVIAKQIANSFIVDLYMCMYAL